VVAPLRPTQPFLPPTIEIARPNVGTVATPKTTQQEAVSFTEKLREAVDKTNELPKVAEQVSEDYADGKQNDLHGTMVSLAQADISLRMVANVRNRAIEAYREIMRMGA